MRRRDRRRHAALLVLAGLALTTLGCARSAGHGRRGNRPDAEPLGPGDSFGVVWDDPSRCAQAVGGGLRSRRVPGRVRIVTWDVRTRDQEPDLDWLACALTYLDADLVALQAVRLDERGRAGLAHLADDLGHGSGANWRWQGDACPADDRPHVALLYRTDRLEVADVKSHPELDPTKVAGAPKDCPGTLRPALGAYVRSRGGFDFHFATAQLDAGHDPRDLEHRQHAWTKLADVLAARQKQNPDDDFVVAGDFATMGCKGCDARTDRDETALMQTALAVTSAPLRLLPESQPCTEYYRGSPSSTDHVLVSATMGEATDIGTKVLGLCGESRCRALREDLPALQRLSEHCPLLVDLIDEDRDP